MKLRITFKIIRENIEYREGKEGLIIQSLTYHLSNILRINGMILACLKDLFCPINFKPVKIKYKNGWRS